MSIITDLADPNVQAAIAKSFRWLKQLKPKENPFSEVPEDMLFRALFKAVELIVNDRFTEGPGKSGWGKSDKLFVTELYGENVASRIEDSVTITVNAIFALRSFISFLMQSDSSEAHKLLCKIGEIVCDDEYVGKRWNSKYGWGGKLLYVKANEFHIAACYRHTAMLLRLWLEDARYCNNIPVTYQYLIDNFDTIDWKRECIDTHILTYVAFKALLSHPQQSNLLDLKKIPILMGGLEASIVSKYKFTLEGWTCCEEQDNLNASRAGRQPFTLCALSEIAGCFSASGDLSHIMERSLRDTINGSWKVANGGFGFGRVSGGEPDIALSCLGASVLLRKQKKSKDEMDYLRGTIDFIVNSFVHNPNVEKGVYLWPVSYFIMDTCKYLHKGVMN